MKKQVITGALALSGFVLLTGFHGGCGRHPHRPGDAAAFVTNRLEDALDDLDATPAQRQQITAIKDRLFADGQKLHANRDADRAEILAQWKSDKPDAAKIHALIDARIDAMRAFAHEAADGAIEAHGVLTPEQRAKVTKKIERHMSEMK